MFRTATLAAAIGCVCLASAQAQQQYTQGGKARSVLWATNATEGDTRVAVDSSGNLVFALPAGAATAARQDAGNTSAATTATNTGSILTSTGAPADSAYAGSGSSSAISALKGIYNRLGSLSFDTTGLATSSKQDTGNTSLAAILSKLSADPATQTTLAAVLSKLSADPATQTTLAAVLAKLSSDPATSAKQDTGNTSLSTIASRTPAPGQAASASSSPVVLPTDPDLRPNSSTITAADAASTTTSGFNSINVITGSATANSSVAQAINGQSSVTVTVTGTFSATLQFELSGDGGTTYVASSMRQRGGGYTSSTTTGQGVFDGDVSGKTHFRVRATAYSSGTATVKSTFSATSGAVQVQNPIHLRDNSSNQNATVKPASTAPAAIDPALVVGISPNSTAQVTTLPTADITGAAAFQRVMALATTNATSVKGSSGNIYAISLCNVSAAAKFLKLYDKATAPTVGTDTPKLTKLIPIGQCLGALDGPIAFSTGIAYALTGAVGDADTTALTANDVVGYLQYQ